MKYREQRIYRQKNREAQLLAPPEIVWECPVQLPPLRGGLGVGLLEFNNFAASLSLLLFAHRCCAATSAAEVREVVKI